MKKFRVKKEQNRQEMICAIEASLLMGFQMMNAEFPVITDTEGMELPNTWEEVGKLWKLSESEIPKEYVSSSVHFGEVFDLDFRREHGLEELFAKGNILKDENHDLLPDQIDIKFILPEQVDRGMLLSACNLAFRFGMETTSYGGNIVAEESYEGNAIVFEDGEEPEMWMEENPSKIRIHLKGRGTKLLCFATEICRTFPQLNVMRSWRDALMEMTDDFVLRGGDGQLAALHAASSMEGKACTLYGAPYITERQKSYFKESTFYNYKSGRKMYEKTYELPWEVTTFHNILKEQVYPKIKKGAVLKIEGALSESREFRRTFAEKIRQEAENQGCTEVDVSLVCAYKQGFSWVTEQIVPKVKEYKKNSGNVQSLEIYFKPFLPEGQTEWVDENGATPSYDNLNAENPDKWYDLPIRYLQELYPVQDVLMKELDLTEEQIVFLPYKGEENITYLVQAYGEGNTPVLKETHKVYCSERPYLDEYPGLGKVHPSTGYIRVELDGEEIILQTVKTDLEEVWDIYQKEVLKDCRNYIETKHNGSVKAANQPLFYKLLLDVSVSEPDERIGCREDMISSLDALHEDMYFAGSDYFKNYGAHHGDGMLDAPGLILPEIHNREGESPRFRVVLFEPLRKQACVLCQEEVVFEQRKREEVHVKISRIGWKKERLQIIVQTDGVSERLLKSYAELMQEKVLGISEKLGNCEVIFLDRNGNSFCAQVEEQEIQKDGKIEEIDLHEQELIGYEMYLEIMEQLKRIPQIEVFETATSYAGRKIYGIWLKPEVKGYLSMTKRLSMIPSEIINARHHANEVSSTNAAFILLKKLLTDEKYRELSQKMNLVLVPMENVDGAAIHYELQKEHPHWKFHVARFNSIGKEFYREHFQQDTLHEEAMGLSRLYEKFVPDILVDNHGVPSHEWEQQFSGYTSPSYKGFWLPRSLLYGYFWYVTNPEYAGNYKVNKVMEDVIADQIAENPEMTAWNKEWSAQFEKYAHAWLPKLFPAEYYKDMINYWIPFAADKNHRYPSIRYPWITTVAYTSEVADETAQGEYLNLCAKAHVAHDEATIQMLMQAEHVVKSSCMCTEQKVFTEYLRQRPMIVRYSEK